MNKILLVGLLAISSLAYAQTAAPAQAVAPATALDAALSQTGVLTIRESLGTKSIPTEFGGQLSLEAIKITIPSENNKVLLGIRMSANSGDKYASTAYEFIEPEEIDGMIKAIDYMTSQASKMSTTTKPELKYTSKSEAQIGIFYSTSENKFSGFAKAGTQNVFLPLGSVSAFRVALAELKTLLK